MGPKLQPLLSACTSAELTMCGLERIGHSRAEPGWAVNAFAVLTFSTAPLPDPRLPIRFLTPKPLSSPTSSHRLFITSSTLSVSEGEVLAAAQGQIRDPRAPVDSQPIESLGTWVGPFFVADNDESIRACVPAMHESFWLKERWQPEAELQRELKPKDLRWLHDNVREVLGVSLAARSERIGNFLVVLPEFRVQMRTRPSSSGQVGVEIKPRSGAPEEFIVVARGSREGQVLNGTVKRVRAGLHILPLPWTVDHRDIELYDASTGLLLHRDAGTPFREANIDMNVSTTNVDLTFNFSRPDGSLEPPIQVRTWWGHRQSTQVGGRQEWERVLDDVKREEEGERLQRAKHFIVYRGSEADRLQALDDIRELLRSAKEFVKVWDPYFGHRDAAEFLPFVTDPTIPIQVLTKLTATPKEKSIVSDGSPPVCPKGKADWKWRAGAMQRVVGKLREPQKGSPGLTGLEVRTGSRAFHDRFLITHRRCWQLGCSFNQIGHVMSTIVEFPYPTVIEREFDNAWADAETIEP